MAGESTLIEREGELARLDDAFARAVDGDGAFVVVEGPAGIGKSRLLDAARVAAGDRGLETMFARGGELERDFSYGLVRQLFERPLRDRDGAARERLLSDAAELAAPALGLAREASATSDSSFAVMHGLYWLTSNLAADEPLALFVDDLHWGDSPSLRFLLYLVARLEGMPVLVIAAARPAEPDADPLVARTVANPGAEALRPGPLSTEGVAVILSERFGLTPDDALVAACHDATGGNPFLISELVDALRRDGLEPTPEAAERVRELGPETVSRSVFLRLARLPEASAQLAQAVAVLGSRPQLRDAATLADLDLPAATEAADALAQVHILSDGAPLDFVHPVVRQAVYAELPAAERAALHARAAEVLRESGATPQELATHLLAAPASGDERAVAALRAAAGSALDQGAADLATRYLRRALEEPPSPDERAAVLTELGHAEWLAAEDPPAAVAHLREALELTQEPDLRAERLLTLARALFSWGDVPSAYDLLEQGLEEVAGADADAVLRLEAELASIGLVHPPTAPRASKRMERFVGMDGATPAELLQVANLAAWKWVNGTAAEAASLAEQSLEGGVLLESEGTESIPLYENFWALNYSDRQDLAWEPLEQALATARSTGSVFGYATSSAVRAILYFTVGDVPACEAEARNAIALGDTLPPFDWPPVHQYLCQALVERGELDEAEDVIGRSGCGPDLPEFVHFNAAFYARGQLRLAQGRIDEALADFRELGERVERLHPMNPTIAWRCGAVEALIRLGQSEEAQRLADEHLELARAWGTDSSIGVGLWARGLALGGEEGIASLREAAEMLAKSPARLDEAYALVDLGAAIRRAGRRADAREPLRQGLDLARRCGATALVEHAHAELTAAGAKPRRLQFSGLESLTASERRVAEMAAQGLTNREIAQELFVTQKTVENHLTRVYSKLDINSRDALPEAMAAPVED